MKKVFGTLSAIVVIGLFVFFIIERIGMENDYQQYTPAEVKAAHVKMSETLMGLNRGDFVVFADDSIACFRSARGSNSILIGFPNASNDAQLNVSRGGRIVTEVVRLTDPEWPQFARRYLTTTR